MTFFDRLLTIIITATLTSAVWIVAGGSLIELTEDRSAPAAVEQPDAVTPAEQNVVATPALPSAEQGLQDLPAPEGLPATATPEPGEATLMIPVKNVRAVDLIDTFLDQRDGQARLHEAIDIEAPAGTAVVAAAPGTIEKMFLSKVTGETMYVRSTDRRTIHVYSHLDSFAEGLKEGQRIRRGQRLGEVGAASATGGGDGEAPHLHFAMLRTTADADWWEPANAVNPYPLLTKSLRD